jgi:hypothetical protein
VKPWPRIALIVTVLVGLAAVILPSGEPVYQGKTLSAWLERYSGNGGPVQPYEIEEARAEATTAVRHIGTNGIPCLLRMAATEDSPVKKWLLRVPASMRVAKYLVSQPLFLRWATKSALGPSNACTGFRLLGPDAKSATPGLIHIMRNGKNSMARIYALLALEAIGPAAENAIPALIENFKDPFLELRDRTVGALFNIASDHFRGRFRPDCTRIMVPRLSELLADPKADALRVIRMLSDIGPDAKDALPAILPFENSSDPNIRAAVTMARERITTGTYPQP